MMTTISIQYCFRLPDQRREVFDLWLNPDRLELESPASQFLPDWTRLDFHQCPNCPPEMGPRLYCPAASHLCDVVERFEDILSYDEVQVDVTTAERRISQDTTAQLAIGSLMGLILAISGCPQLAFFKPMARFHLPLATEEETVYRAVSMYLMAQYFMNKAGGKADFDLEGLKKIYSDVERINVCMADRLRSATETDSSLNAFVTLDMFAKGMLFVLEESLEEIRSLFTPYLRSL